jgi:probable rRNA maturation factor
VTARTRNRIALNNRQRVKKLDLRRWRRVLGAVLEQSGATAFDLGVYCVGAAEMTRLNEGFLRHRGSTDVITFDYGELAHPESLHGEIFICIDEAIIQARRFRTTWQSELVRYVVHGILHLQGFDDARPRDRRRMKREEALRLKKVASRFNLERLSH